MTSSHVLAVGAASMNGRSGMDSEKRRAKLIAACVIYVVISIPLILRVVPPNGIYGFRNHATLSSATIWYPANAFAGWALVVAAVISAGLLLTLPPAAGRWLVWAAFLMPLFAAYAASVVYLNHFH
jgi:uncharacterized membrane protein